MYRFYYGENTYSLLEKTSQLERDFVEKNGDFNLVKVDGGNLTLEQFQTNTLSMPFLGDKRLFIIKNLLLDNSDKDFKKKIAELIPKMPEHTIVLFIESGLPDKRESLFKTLDKKETAAYFPPLDDLKLRDWVKNEFLKNGVSIGNQEVFKLTFTIGADLWRLKNEIFKISNFVLSQNRNNVTSLDISKFVSQADNFKIFDLTDSLAKKDSKKAASILNSFLESGEDEFMIFNMIVFQFRNMLLIADLAATARESEIAKIAGIHPFVVKKTLESLKKFKKSDLKQIYDQLAEIDHKIKTGQSELKTALSLLVVQLCEK